MVTKEIVGFNAWLYDQGHRSDAAGEVAKLATLDPKWPDTNFRAVVANYVTKEYTNDWSLINKVITTMDEYEEFLKATYGEGIAW